MCVLSLEKQVPVSTLRLSGILMWSLRPAVVSITAAVAVMATDLTLKLSVKTSVFTLRVSQPHQGLGVEMSMGAWKLQGPPQMLMKV